VVYGTALLTRSALERHHPFESDRFRQSVGCVGATGLPYRAVNPGLFRALKVRILPHPPGNAHARFQCDVKCSRSLMGERSRLSIEQMPVRIRSAAPTIYHAVR
jgi:hypothetical protein